MILCRHQGTTAGKGIQRRVSTILRGVGVRGRNPSAESPYHTLVRWVQEKKATWSTVTDEVLNLEQQQAELFEAIKQEYSKRWKLRWQHGVKGAHSRQLQPHLSSQTLKIHQGLRKHESALVVQLRTGKTGFMSFLHKMRVPEVDSPNCTCGQELTVTHIILHCPR